MLKKCNRAYAITIVYLNYKHCRFYLNFADTIAMVLNRLGPDQTPIFAKTAISTNVVNIDDCDAGHHSWIREDIDPLFKSFVWRQDCQMKIQQQHIDDIYNNVFLF